MIALVVALFAVAVLITGVHMAHVFDDTMRACRANGTCDLVGNLFSGYGAIVDVVHLSIALPLVLAMFLGAPLVAREMENSTNVLVWTQTVTRRRWLYSKIATVFAITLVTSAAVSVLVTWWSGTPNSLDGNRFEGAQFDTQNILPIAFALFAVALALAAGAWFRRTLPALAATVGIYAAVRILVVVYLRPHYLKATVKSFAFGLNSAVPSGSMTVNMKLLDAAGKASSGQINIPASCGVVVNRQGADRCLTRLGYRNAVTFQPPSHYWPFQWIESGLFIALAVVLVVFAIRRTLRRDA